MKLTESQARNGNNENIGDKNRVTVEEVDRKVDTIGARLIQTHSEMRQEFRSNRSTMDGFNTRLLLFAGFIVASMFGLLELYDRNNTIIAQPQKTMTFEEAAIILESTKEKEAKKEKKAEDLTANDNAANSLPQLHSFPLHANLPQ